MTKPKHGGGRGHCTVCSHPKRAEIDTVLAQGLSLEKAATMFGLNASSLRRHKTNHPSGLTKLEASEDIPTPDSGEVVSVSTRRTKLKAHVARTLRHLKQAEDSGSAMAISQANREYRLAMVEMNAFEQKQEALRIAAHQGDGVVINVLQTEAWVDARRKIMRALEPYPDARIHVSNVLMELEDPDYRPDTNRFVYHQPPARRPTDAVDTVRATRPAARSDQEPDWSDAVQGDSFEREPKLITVT